MVLVYGDTTTTLAGALAAAKLDLPIGHVEAGLRSFDRSMPEEQNRVVTDHLSSLLLCPTDTAVENLAREGITEGVHQVGDVMLDASLMFAPAAAARPGPAGPRTGARRVPAGDGAPGRGHRHAGGARRARGRAGGHRPSRRSSRSTRARATGWRRPASGSGWRRTRRCASRRPVGYLDFTSLLVGAQAVVTDSGGVQKEAYFLGIPCITLRDTTEWVETVDGGFNRLVGMDPARVARRPRRPVDARRAPALLRRRRRGRPNRRRGGVGRGVTGVKRLPPPADSGPLASRLGVRSA